MLFRSTPDPTRTAPATENPPHLMVPYTITFGSHAPTSANPTYPRPGAPAQISAPSPVPSSTPRDPSPRWTPAPNHDSPPTPGPSQSSSSPSSLAMRTPHHTLPPRAVPIQPPHNLHKMHTRAKSGFCQPKRLFNLNTEPAPSVISPIPSSYKSALKDPDRKSVV